MKRTLTFVLVVWLSGCLPNSDASMPLDEAARVRIAGAMKNVMQRGDLQNHIRLDTIKQRAGLYGLGPGSGLQGELLILDGQSYFSRVAADSSMRVQQTYDVAAPFLVYSHINNWQQIDLPGNISNLDQLSQFLENRRPADHAFGFKLSGKVKAASIHVQNLPKGSKISSPQDAHRGQVKYQLQEQQVDIVGFFSRKHQGVFTHHDSYLHAHLITRDRRQMGHLDAVDMEQMMLYLPR